MAGAALLPGGRGAVNARLASLLGAAALLASLGAAAQPAAPAPLPVQGQGQGQVQVMVLGTHHFASPGLDLYNARFDDVLSARRQAEVAEVVERLARFKPTVVAVEARADELPGRALPAYAAVRAGSRPLGRNETEQIGFRLAQAAGLAQVLGIDAPGEFPFEAVQAFAAEQGRSADLQASLDAMGRRTRSFEGMARTATLAALLRHLNQPASLREDHAWYLQVLAFGQGDRQPGAELLGRWMTRNMGTCARLLQSVKPGDRAFVLIGAGHATLLRQCVQGMPGWQLVEPGPYLP